MEEEKKTPDKIAEAVGRAIGVILVIIVAVILLILGVILLILATVITLYPFYLCYLASSSKRKANEILNENRDRFRFWLNENEKTRYKALRVTIATEEKKREEAIRAAEQRGVTKNEEGQYNDRTELGRAVRNVLEHTDEVIAEASKEVDSLKKKPLEDWEEASAAFDNQVAAPAGIKGFLWALPVAAWKVSDAIRLENPDYPLFYSILFWWGMASCVGLVVYFIRRFFFSSLAEQFFEKPPEVNLSNIDSWNKQTTLVVLEETDPIALPSPRIEGGP
jgi:flagellar basal body-associated protein FliL